MSDTQQNANRNTSTVRGPPPPVAARCIDWYVEGEERVVEVDGVRVSVRFVGRKGRRGRIAITAPPGAAFRSSDRGAAVRSPDRSGQ